MQRLAAAAAAEQTAILVSGTAWLSLVTKNY
jgi:hypothetical protein